MTLRERVARAMYRRLSHPNGPWSRLLETNPGKYYTFIEMADAAIAELRAALPEPPE